MHDAPGLLKHCLTGTDIITHVTCSINCMRMFRRKGIQLQQRCVVAKFRLRIGMQHAPLIKAQTNCDDGPLK